eukprot:364308-Chlamydomonas_euryale.AAC.6
MIDRSAWLQSRQAGNPSASKQSISQQAIRQPAGNQTVIRGDGRSIRQPTPCETSARDGRAMPPPGGNGGADNAV